MNTLTKGLLVLVLFVIAGVAAACNRGGDTTAAAQVTPAPAKASGKIVAEGSVVPVRYARLGFAVPGTVSTLSVQLGDKVTKDQVIAKLDTTDYETAVQKAQAAIKTAEANLAKTKAGARSEDVAAAEAKVGVAEAAVKAAQGRLSAAQGQAAEAQAGITAAQGRLSAAQGQASEAQAGITAAQGGLQASQAALDKLKAGPTEEDIAIAQRKVEQAKNQAWGIQANRDAVCGRATGPKEFRTTDQAQCDQAQAQVQANDENIRLAELALQQLQNGARDEDVRSAEAAVTQSQGSVASAQARARTGQGNVQAAQGDVANAQARARTGQGNVQAAQGDVDNAQANLDAANAELERVKVPARAEDIAVAEAQVNEAKVALTAAQADLDKASMKAPFDGVITTLDIKQGERAQANTPIITVADTSKWQVETTDLTELNVVRLKVGDPVTITFDALPDVTLPGTITRISDQGENKQGDIVYTVTVTPNQWDDRLRWKMTASVNFEPSR